MLGILVSKIVALHSISFLRMAAFSEANGHRRTPRDAMQSSSRITNIGSEFKVVMLSFLSQNFVGEKKNDRMRNRTTPLKRNDCGNKVGGGDFYSQQNLCKDAGPIWIEPISRNGVPKYGEWKARESTLLPISFGKRDDRKIKKK